VGEGGGGARPVIIHLPHASALIPERERAGLSLSEEDLNRELLRMTDWYADALFDLGPDAMQLVFPVSRLVVDPERFVDDAAEHMAAKGLGAIYIKTSDGQPLRPSLDVAERERLLQSYYHPHHAMLERLTAEAVADHGRCLIIDAHTFPSSPLPCDFDQSLDRPDICLGTDSFHTPDWLQQIAVQSFRAAGWSVELNRPYSGTIVPMRHYQTDARVHSIMVEVNRALYMDETSGERLPRFDAVRRNVRSALEAAIAAVC